MDIATPLQFIVVDNRDLQLVDFMAEASFDNFVRESHALIAKYLVCQRDHAWLPRPYVFTAASADAVKESCYGENQLSDRDIPRLNRIIPRTSFPVSSGENLSLSTWSLLTTGIKQAMTTVHNVVYGITPESTTLALKPPAKKAKFSIVFITTSVALSGGGHWGGGQHISSSLVALKDSCQELLDSLPCANDVEVKIVCCKLESDAAGAGHDVRVLPDGQSRWIERVSENLAEISLRLSQPHAADQSEHVSASTVSDRLESVPTSKSSFGVSLYPLLPTRLDFEELLRVLITDHAPAVNSTLSFPKTSGQQASVNLLLRPQTLQSADLIAPRWTHVALPSGVSANKGTTGSNLTVLCDLEAPEVVGLVSRSGLPACSLAGGSLTVTPQSPSTDWVQPMTISDTNTQDQQNSLVYAALSCELMQRDQILILRCDSSTVGVGLGSTGSCWALVPPAAESTPPVSAGLEKHPLASRVSQPMTLLRLVTRESLLLDIPTAAFQPVSIHADILGGSAALGLTKEEFFEILEETQQYFSAVFNNEEKRSSAEAYNPLSHTSGEFKRELQLIKAQHSQQQADNPKRSAESSLPTVTPSTHNYPPGSAAAAYSHSHNLSGGRALLPSLSSPAAQKLQENRQSIPAQPSARSHTQHGHSSMLELASKHPLLQQKPGIGERDRSSTAGTSKTQGRGQSVTRSVGSKTQVPPKTRSKSGTMSKKALSRAATARFLSLDSDQDDDENDKEAASAGELEECAQSEAEGPPTQKRRLISSSVHIRSKKIRTIVDTSDSSDFLDDDAFL